MPSKDAGKGRGLWQSAPTPVAATPRPSFFQQARDLTTFVVSIASLLTASFALKNTLTGPLPVLADLQGLSPTILRSDQFVLGGSTTPAIVLRGETGEQADFPLLIAPVTISNRAAPPNGVGIRSIDATLTISRAGRTVFQSDYAWYRFTASSSVLDGNAKVDRLVVENAVAVAPFDLAGGTTWSREVLLIPRETWLAQGWPKFEEGVHGCQQGCDAKLTLRTRMENGQSQATQCSFAIDRHMLAHVSGKERRFFTTPTCGAGHNPR